jgi:hypothetical protein
MRLHTPAAIDKSCQTSARRRRLLSAEAPSEQLPPWRRPGPPAKRRKLPASGGAGPRAASPVRAVIPQSCPCGGGTGTTFPGDQVTPNVTTAAEQERGHDGSAGVTEPVNHCDVSGRLIIRAGTVVIELDGHAGVGHPISTPTTGPPRRPAGESRTPATVDILSPRSAQLVHGPPVQGIGAVPRTLFLVPRAEPAARVVQELRFHGCTYRQ